MERVIIDLSETEGEAESKEEIAFRLLRKKRQLKRELFKLKTSLPLSLNDAFDRYFEGQPSAYLKIENRLDHLTSLFEVLEKQIHDVDCRTSLSRVTGRLSFVADRLDEIEADLYQRPRRRHQGRFNLSDFFEHFTKQSKEGSSSERQEISTLSEAYQVLNLEEGGGLPELLVAFRRLAKKHHPDARGGDRSKEQEFRRVLEAYQLIKEFLSR